jgi:hypothetical protein
MVHEYAGAVGRVGAFLVVTVLAAVAAAVAFAARSPQQWRTAMLHAAAARHSVHYVSSSATSKAAIRLVSDVAKGRGIQRITVTKNGQRGLATVLVVGGSAYIRGNAFTLHDYFPFTQAQAARYAGKWISIPSSSGAYAAVAADATFASFLDDLLPSKHLTLVRATISGTESVGVRGPVRQGGVKLVETVYAPASGTPLPFEEKAVVAGHPGVSQTRISKWNESVRLHAPAQSVPISTVVGS